MPLISRIVIALACCVSARAEQVYMVGNSLTLNVGIQGIQDMSNRNGGDLYLGYHNRGNTALNYFQANPQIYNNIKPTSWDVALPGYNWDVVTMQPYTSASSTLSTDINAIKHFIGVAQERPANADTRFYVYAPWARLANFDADWNSSVVDSGSQPTSLSESYFDLLMDHLAADSDLASVDLGIIPAGAVLAEVKRRIELGLISSVTDFGDLYGDDVHLSPLGSFVAGTTVYATVYGVDPRMLGTPVGTYGSPSDATAFAIQDAVYDVLTGDYGITLVPEPGTFALLSVYGIAFYRRQRFNSTRN